MPTTDDMPLLRSIICDLMDDFTEVAGSRVTAIVEAAAATVGADQTAIERAARARLEAMPQPRRPR